MKRLVIAVAVLALAGCGGGDAVVPEGQQQQAHGHGAATSTAPPPAATARFNDADVMFAQMMVAHLQQGIDLAVVAKAMATGPKVKELAGAVDSTQREELEMLKGWLKLWGKPEQPSSDPNVHAAHGGMPLLDAKVISDVKDRSKEEFDLAYLNLMTGHQGGAVEMAQTELKDGSNPETTAYAQRVRDSRSGQIQQMLTLINGQ
ncbi:hypothetical protein BBK82_20205 [Lentzea guizhouensis]|uniref:DUF305 domain-containing protein n=1 Tax=Lentzea guizhouensis TaxID=1586287 RepID=A0A1B2HJZ0_9PSEU|nr:DUF305 domain-containing protein [Lentzea guizhouensis]ANZ38035.1 hypothetical protein BBK82_20205 [Lentzea guizhouensis]